MMSKNEIRLAISKLEVLKVKNTEEFELRESRIRQLLDLFTTKELV